MTVELGAYGPSLFGGTQPVLQAQFRNPLFPNINNFGLTVPTSPLEGSVSFGDSGGPVFIQTPDGLIQIGEARSIAPCPDFCGQYFTIMDWTPLSLFLDWVAQNNPLREVTAAAGNFNWSNPAAWIDSVHGSVQAVIVDDSRYVPASGAGTPAPGALCGRERSHRRARERRADAGLWGVRNRHRLGLREQEALLSDQGAAARGAGRDSRPHVLGAGRRRLGQDRRGRQCRRREPQS
jgi:hypothetical protein